MTTLTPVQARQSHLDVANLAHTIGEWVHDPWSAPEIRGVRESTERLAELSLTAHGNSEKLLMNLLIDSHGSARPPLSPKDLQFESWVVKTAGELNGMAAVTRDTQTFVGLRALAKNIGEIEQSAVRSARLIAPW